MWPVLLADLSALTRLVRVTGSYSSGMATPMLPRHFRLGFRDTKQTVDNVPPPERTANMFDKFNMLSILSSAETLSAVCKCLCKAYKSPWSA